MSASCYSCYRTAWHLCSLCDSPICDKHNETHKCCPVSSVTIPGLGTKVRYLPEEEIAQQELLAHEMP